MFKRLLITFICTSFVCSNFQYVQAQDFSINQLPVPGSMINLSENFAPMAIKGIVVNPQKPMEFQFIVDTGNGPQDDAHIKDTANDLVKYFFAGLTIPEGDLWVNLSPYEKDRMTTPSLGATELGRDLLAQDYILKQLTASLIYPEKGLGKEFWNRVYAKAQKQFGTTNVPVNTFNKVWIMPDQAQVFQNGGAAYVTKATLKVMLDEDYLAQVKHQGVQGNSVSSQIIRDIVIPEITKEVNTGKNFATVRQMYNALILAKWYKQTVQNNLFDALYTNKSKIAGVNLADPAVKEQIYKRYLQAYKKGVFNFIKETSTPQGQVESRKYFSGGIMKLEPPKVEVTTDKAKFDGAMIGGGFTKKAILVTLRATMAAVIGVTSSLVNTKPAKADPGTLGIVLTASSISSAFADLIALGLEEEASHLPNTSRRKMELLRDARDWRELSRRLNVTTNFFDAIESITGLNLNIFSWIGNQIESDLRRTHKFTDSDMRRIRALSDVLGIVFSATAIRTHTISRVDYEKLIIKLKCGCTKIVIKRVVHNKTEYVVITPIVAGTNVLGARVERRRDMPSVGVKPMKLGGEPQNTLRDTKDDRDRAMLKSGAKDEQALPVGGIDLNQINVNRTGRTFKVQFDPAQLQSLEENGFQGFNPVVVKIINITSPLPLMGIGQMSKAEQNLASA